MKNSSESLYTICFYSEPVRLDVEAMPTAIRVRLKALFDRMIQFGSNLGPPHTEQVPGYPGLFELRAKAKEGIGRVYYCTKIGREIWVLHSIVKKTQKAPPKDLKLAEKRMKEVRNAG